VGPGGKCHVSWRRLGALAVPLAVAFFVLGFVVGLGVQRGPNWRLDLDDYAAVRWAQGERIQVREQIRARRPENFTTALGRAV